jgi:hypothetical protein
MLDVQCSMFDVHYLVDLGIKLTSSEIPFYIKLAISNVTPLFTNSFFNVIFPSSLRRKRKSTSNKDNLAGSRKWTI